MVRVHEMIYIMDAYHLCYTISTTMRKAKITMNVYIY
jgi:hypothetical protein